jgi:hypothetical protein
MDWRIFYSSPESPSDNYSGYAAGAGGYWHHTLMRENHVHSIHLLDSDWWGYDAETWKFVLTRDDSPDSLVSADEENLELWPIGMIEKLRRMLLQQNSILYMATYQVQYQWRGDDAVALFLIACQHILGRRDATAKVDEEDWMKNANSRRLSAL